MLNLEKETYLILWASRLKLEILTREEFCINSGFILQSIADSKLCCS